MATKINKMHKGIGVKWGNFTAEYTVQEISRGGTKSPTMYLIFTEGGKRRVTPFEQRLKGYEFMLNGLFKLVYGDSMKDLIYNSNPFLKIPCSKDEKDTWGAYYTPQPLRLKRYR